MSERTAAQHNIERAVQNALSEFAVDFSVQHWTSDQTSVAHLSYAGYETTYHFTWLPQATLSELSRLERFKQSRRLLVCGPQISTRTADALRSSSIDYIDYAGNAYLQFGPVLIDVRGRHNSSIRLVSKPQDENLFTARRMQVIFALLAWPSLVGMPVRTIAEASGTSVGMTQSTLKIMEASGYLVGESQRRRKDLLNLWVAAFRGTLIRKIRVQSFRGDVEEWSPGPGTLVSGESAVELVRRPQTLTLYTESFDLMDAVRNGWQRSDEPNIEVRVKFWKMPPWEQQIEKRNILARSAVPPLLIYADLISTAEPRLAEVARALRDEDLV